ncbi:hypothetical protein BSF41_12230 [Flavobacterium sp. ACN2]|nr:hypothetical protein BSF41_12230 [Flavobacterium sp. ACN2]
MFQKELPLVAFLKQETFAFFTPGFPLQSGLSAYMVGELFLQYKFKYFFSYNLYGFIF